MHLAALRLTNYRNFSEQRLAIPAEGVAIVGDNGQGKTNLLEAIYYLEIFRSFRGAPDEQLVRFGEDVFRVEGKVLDVEGRARTIAAAYDRRQKRKKVAIDGVEPPRLAEALGHIGVVIFSPSDVTLVAGSPSVRRRFLDILLSLASPFYLEDLRRFRQVLLQRNASLRRGDPAPLVAAWDDGLVRFGSRIMSARNDWVVRSAALFAQRVGQIAGGATGYLEYEPGIPNLPASSLRPEGISEAYRMELHRLAERERRQGATLVGPHRDDLRVRAANEPGGDPVDLRTFGSGGQQRTAAVALRMVEGETLRDRLGSDPVILLDDVFAELDPNRSRRILEWVEAESHAQVLLTAPKPGDFVLRGGSLPLWRIANVTLSPL